VSPRPILGTAAKARLTAQHVRTYNCTKPGYAADLAELKKNTNGYCSYFKARKQSYFGVAMSTSGYQANGMMAMRRLMHKNVQKADHKYFDIDASTTARQSRGIAEMNWNVDSRFAYYTAALCFRLHKSLALQADATYEASFCDNMSSKDQRKRSQASSPPHQHRNRGRSNSTSNARTYPVYTASPLAQPESTLGIADLLTIRTGDVIDYLPSGFRPVWTLRATVVALHNKYVLASREYEPDHQVQIPIARLVRIVRQDRPDAAAESATPTTGRWKQASSYGQIYWYLRAGSKQA